MIKILNLREIQNNLEKQVKVVSKTLEEGLKEVGERAVGVLDRNTPVDEGRLRNSMSYTIAGQVYDPLGADETNDKLRKITDKDKVIIGTNVKYAARVEYLAKNGSAGFMLRSYKLLVPIAKRVLESVMRRRFK